jgi:hypothetical protein
MSAPAGGAGSAAAAAPQIMINTTSTLPEAFPDKDTAEVKEEREWKRYLFYIVGYCDTFHDFADARNTVGEGTSLKLGVKGSVRGTYVLNNIINAMDNINFPAIYGTIGGGGTFEKSMYATFTNFLFNPLFGVLDRRYSDKIREHISNIHAIPTGMAFQQFTIGNGDVYFADLAGGGGSSAAAALDDLPATSIIELRIPAKVYGDRWQNKFIDFLHHLFPNCLSDGRLKIVEDTATFPRELFTSNPANFARFQKLDVPQTRWDPAGLTHFNDKNMTNLVKPNINVSAPSFRSLEAFSTGPDTIFSKNNAYFIQDARTNSLVLPGQNPARIDNLRAGPTVNHLFMHIIVHSDLTPICAALDYTPATIAARSESIKRDAKRLINAANNPLKGSKNITLKLQPGDVSNPTLLRKYTTSKRTGDYENTNAAKYHNAVLFCGDEPEFVYAMLNEQPAIYHTHEAGGHKFRIYNPKTFGLTTEEQEVRERDQVITNYIHKAFELTRLFTNVKTHTMAFFDSITRIFPETLTFPESNDSREIQRILKYIICIVIIGNTPLIKELKKSYTTFERLSGPIKEKLSQYNIEGIDNQHFQQLKSRLLAVVETESELNNLKEEIAKLDATLKAPLNATNRSLNINLTNATPNSMDAFRETNSNPLFKLSTGRGYTLQSPLFQILNNLNSVIPELIKSYNFIASQGAAKGSARSIKAKMASEKNEIIKKLKGFGIPENFYEKSEADKSAEYSAAALALKAVIEEFKSQAGGVTNNRRYTRRNILSAKKHPGTRTKNRKRQDKQLHSNTNTRSHIHLDKVPASELYKYIKESIIKLGDAPFGLTNEQYANQIVFRMIVIDSMHEIIGKKTNIYVNEPITPTRLQKHLLENAIYSESDSEINQDQDIVEIMTAKKLKLHVQSGGALSSEEDILLYRIYIDGFIPLWDTLHRNGTFSPRNSILISIINGSFIELVIPLLEELESIEAVSPEMLSIVNSAKTALGKINRFIDYSFNNEYYIYMPINFTITSTFVNQADLNAIINMSEKDCFTVKSGNYSATDRFIRSIETYLSFLGSVLKVSKRVVALSEADEGKFEAELEKIGALTQENYEPHMTSIIPYMNDNISFILQLHYRFFYQDITDAIIGINPADIEEIPDDDQPSAGGGAAAATAETMGGGRRHIAGHERKKGKRRSSPRRLSLKNR